MAETKVSYFPKILRRDTSFYLLGWTPSTVDSHDVLSAIMATPNEKGQGQFNLGAYSNPKLDELTLKIQSETDQKKRNDMIREAFKIHQDDVGHIPLHQQALAWATSKKRRADAAAEQLHVLQVDHVEVASRRRRVARAGRRRRRAGAARPALRSGAARARAGPLGAVSRRRLLAFVPQLADGDRRGRRRAALHRRCGVRQRRSRRTTRSTSRRSSSSDSMLPPAWMEGGTAKYLLGTDEQGRDVLSALMYGARISLFVGGASVLLSLVIGVSLGLLSGYVGGRLDALIMRICDVMLSFPSILIALLFAGVGHALFPNANDIARLRRASSSRSRCPGWVQYARAVRGSTMVERNKEYVQAARVIGVPPLRIMLRHVLPNVMGPVLVLSTIQVAVAILAEATLSFLGVGVSPTSPSLGTFINEGNKQLFSGAWWLVIFPGATLVLIALSINLFGDWLRDALNPRLR